MKRSQIHRSKGFAAVTVLVISLLGGLIVFDTVKENVNQERMAGNYAKELNAHLQAENGLAASYNAMSADSDLDSETMMSALTAIQNNKQDDPDAHRYSLEPWVAGTSTEISTDGSGDDSDETIVETIVSTVFGGTSNTETSSASTSNASNAILIESKGFHYDGQYEMRGSLTVSSSGGSSVFNGPITTCDGATLTGQTIDSYDSSLGAYNSNSNSNDNGDISTINANSDITIKGYSPVNGDVSVNGNLNIEGSGYITGNAHVDGDVDLAANGGSGAVYGDITATGNVKTSYSTESNTITTNGDVTIPGNYLNTISYQGDLNAQNWAQTPNATHDASTVALVANIEDQECDPLHLADEFEDSDLEALATSTVTILDFNSNSNNITLSDDDTYASPVNIDFLGVDTDVYVLDINGLLTNSQTLTIASNITIYLPEVNTGSTANTYIQGNIEVLDGASLTIITESSIGIKGNVKGYDSNGDLASSVVNSEGNNYLNIYSGYNSEEQGGTGLTIDNNGSGYITAYAPAADIKLAGAGVLYGSFRGKTLDASNGAAIHYDEALADSNTGSTASGEASVSITRWF